MARPKIDAITVPRGFLATLAGEREYLDHFAPVFGRSADVLEIHEIPGTDLYLIGPVGTGIAYASPGFDWKPLYDRIRAGYLKPQADA